MARKFLLCFHDFSVWNYQKVTPILETLKDIAGAPFSILFIPIPRPPLRTPSGISEPHSPS